MTITQWFHPNVKPTRRGVYQRAYGQQIAYSRWDGTKWCCGSFEFSIAGKERTTSWQQCLPWRGLAEQPK